MANDPVVPLQGGGVKQENDYLDETRRAIFNILEDVSTSEAELKLKTEELLKFQQATDVSFDHIVISDPNGVIVYANHAAEVMTGYSREEIVGHTPALWGRQMSRDFYETMWRTIKIEKHRYAGELTNKRKDGTRYLSSLRITPILDENQEILFYVGIERDITEERQYQKKIVGHAAELERINTAIAEEKDRAQSILRFLRSIGEGVFATDREGRIIFMNETAELLSGKILPEGDACLSHDVFPLVTIGHDGEKKLDIVKTVLEQGRMVAFSDDTFLTRSDGVIPVSGTCSLIRDEHHVVIGTITVFQDMTKRHELDQMKDNFLSVAAHQLRTPLGGMRWNMELLLDGDFGKLTKKAQEAVRQMYENSQRMILLVNDLLAVARIDDMKGREEKSWRNIERMVSDVINAMQSEADRHGVKLVMKKYRGALPDLLMPVQHLYEALENLLSNSIKYTRSGGVVTVSIKRRTNDILIAIADTGIGIPEEHQSKVFSKFFRAPNARRKETEGSGLGLSVVKSYIDEAGGKIRFESQEDVGTTFFVELPIDSMLPETKRDRSS